MSLNLFKNSEISQETFLKDYWHKKPLLIKAAFSAENLAVLPNKQKLIELCGYEEVQSRMVSRDSESSYNLEHGPFIESDITEINEHTPWNLLVSDIEKWCPETHQFLQYFNFIRSWLFDDLMLSCGSIGGSVGPHLDNYDVFLVQSQGQRLWQYSSQKAIDTQWLPDHEIKVLKNFEYDHEVLMNPGDILYLPPRFAHHGVVQNTDCVTCSIGLRTPSAAELLAAYSEEIAKSLPESKRFIEPETSAEKGEFDAKDLGSVQNLIDQNLKMPANDFRLWFGKFITEYRSLFYEFSEPKETKISPKATLHLNSFSKICYSNSSVKNHSESLSNSVSNVDLFANGEHYLCSKKLAKNLCNHLKIEADEYQSLTQNDKNILQKLFENDTIQQRSEEKH